MLVLTRKTGESIVVGNEVVVTVLEVRGDQVRIGIKAPRSIQVHREEVYREIEQTNASAAASVKRASSMLSRGSPPGAAAAQKRPPKPDAGPRGGKPAGGA